MRSGRMVWIVLVVVAALAVAATAAAQAEAGRLIERPWTYVLEIFLEGGTQYAAEVPFSGETSDFGGLCSEPVDLMWRFVSEGLDSIFGHLTGTTIVCVSAEWGVDAQGAPTMTGMRFTDWGGPISLPDGSTIDAEYTLAWVGFDADTGHETSAFSIATSGGGTGRFAGATLFGTVHCQRANPAAIEAGVEPQLCVMQGMIHYVPLAGAGE